MKLTIDRKRLGQWIDELALITEAEPPVVTRVLFSEADLRARAWVIKRCEEVGLTVRQDAVGNIFARWEGKDSKLPPVATGSHIDAIPNAGRFDGVVGVLGGLEAIDALRKEGYEPRHSIELIIFTAEEPTRFGIGCLGSRLLAGALPLERARALRDSEGRSLEELRKGAGCVGELESVQLQPKCYRSFVELHIEQGPILEKSEVSLGLVEHIAGPSSYRVTLHGEGGHAGSVLMHERHDASLAGAEIALAVERAALASGSADTVATTGVFRVEPGAVNGIPFRATLEIDLRDIKLERREAVLAEIKKSAEEICSRRGVRMEFEEINSDPPAQCDFHIIAHVELAAYPHKLRSQRMVSRAYHDSLFMARICPTTMIFIPCRNGWSHRPEEFAEAKHIAAGTTMLAYALADLAG